MTTAQTRQEAKAARIERYAAAAKVVASGVCPDCGRKLRRNLSLAGWWKCGANGSPGFRAPEYESQPECGFECWTEF